MGATSLTQSFTSTLALTLDKVRPVLEDQIVKNNALLYFLRKSGNWKGQDSLGAQLRVPLMYELGTADSYAGFGSIDTTPSDGITDAFYSWRQAAATISLSGLDEAQNLGREGFIDIVKARTKQGVMGLEDFFSKALLQGQAVNDSSSIASAYVSGINASTFVDPLGLLVKYDPTSSTSIGNINQSTNSWWRNQTADSTASAYAAFLKEMRNMYNLCSKGGGGQKGRPNLVLMNQSVHELYESALAATHRNPDYQVGDIPFENLKFKGSAAIWDENVPDAKNGDLDPDGSDEGTAYFLNTNFLGVTYHNGHNFSVGEFQEPIGQDAKTAKVLWYGAAYTSQRRKQGVLAGITTTISS